MKTNLTNAVRTLAELASTLLLTLGLVVLVAMGVHQSFGTEHPQRRGIVLMESGAGPDSSFVEVRFPGAVPQQLVQDCSCPKVRSRAQM